ncbi:MAG: hypothetical protein MJ236_05810 [Clostridia bacterium]|nr:hypothetical protein [Clostridia bacterium]
MKKIIIILMALTIFVFFVACGSIGDDSGNDTNQVTDNEGNKDNVENNEEFVLNVKEDNHTVVITIGNTTHVFTHDGTNVTGYKTYIDYGDKEVAKIVESSLKGNLDEGINSVEANGGYVVINYNQDGFLYTTYEDLMEYSNILKNMDK